MLLKYNRKAWLTVYGPEEDAKAAADAKVAADTKAAADAAKAAETAAKLAEEDKPTLSQKKVNELLAEEKRKAAADKQKVIDQLETLKSKTSLSETEKEKLSTQIEDLKNSLLTKEQLAQKEREKLEKEHKDKLEQKEKEAKTNWERYEKTLIERSILDAASANDAFSPRQFINELAIKTQLVRDKDENGNELETFTPRVKFPDKNKEGKRVVLDLTVEEAVKRMKDQPELYGNFFKSGLVGGLGANNNGTAGTNEGDAPPTDPDKYRTWRKKNKTKY